MFFGDGVERPHPGVQDCTGIHGLGQAVLFSGRLERGVADGVAVAVGDALVSVGGHGRD